MAGRPIWYELMTPDPAAVAPFYKAVLGWDILGLGTETPSGHPYWMIDRVDGGHAGGVLLLTPEMQVGGGKPGWLPYFEVDDVRASTAQAEGMGAKVWMPPMDAPFGTMAMLGDPQGAPFYLMNPTPPPDQPDAKSDVFDPAAPGRCAWNELNTDDAAAQEAFYASLLGIEIVGDMPMPGDNTYTFIAAEGVGIGAIGSMKPEGIDTAWLPYFRAGDIDAAKEAVEANGGVVLMDTHEVPGGDWIIVATDPAGARLGVVGSKGD